MAEIPEYRPSKAVGYFAKSKLDDVYWNSFTQHRRHGVSKDLNVVITYTPRCPPSHFAWPVTKKYLTTETRWKKLVSKSADINDWSGEIQRAVQMCNARYVDMDDVSRYHPDSDDNPENLHDAKINCSLKAFAYLLDPGKKQRELKKENERSVKIENRERKTEAFLDFK